MSYCSNSDMPCFMLSMSGKVNVQFLIQENLFGVYGDVYSARNLLSEEKAVVIVLLTSHSRF